MEKILLRITKAIVFLVLLTPLVLGPFGLNMSEYPKAVFFRALVELAVVFYVFLVLLNKSYLPKKTALLISVFAYVLVAFVTSFFGINFYRSFWGDLYRAEGIVMHLHLLAFFIIITGIFLRKEDWLNLLKASVVVSAVSSLAGVLQILKIASFYDLSFPAIAAGTLSNPNLFGNYISLCVFLALFLFFAENKKLYKPIWLAIAVLNFWGLIFSYTRGAWFGFAMGGVFVFFYFLFKASFKKRIIALFCILTISLLVLFVFANPALFKLGNSRIYQRIQSVFGLEFSGRIEMWKMSVSAIKDRPFWGWGAESFGFVSDKYFLHKYVPKTSVSVNFDRPHNKVLEVLVYSGIVGLIAYLTVFFLIFYNLYKHWKNLGHCKTALIAGFFVCYFFENIFLFDSICTYILFFVVLGFVNSKFANQLAVQAKVGGMTALKLSVGLFVFLAMALVFYQLNFRPAKAAMLFPEYIKYESYDIKKSLSGYEKAVSQNTIYDSDLRMVFAERAVYLVEAGLSLSPEKNFTNALVKIRPKLYRDLEKSDLQRNHLFEYIARINEYDFIIKKNSYALEQMKDVTDKAILFNPEISAFWQLSGEQKFLEGRFKEGELDIKKACLLDPWGCSNDAELYKRMAAAYFKADDAENTIKNLEIVLSLDYEYKKYFSKSAVSGIWTIVDTVAILYARNLKDFKSAEQVYQKAIEAYPEYSEFFESHLKVLMSESVK